MNSGEDFRRCDSCGGSGKNEIGDGAGTIIDASGAVIAVLQPQADCKWCLGTGRRHYIQLRPNGRPGWLVEEPGP